MLQKGRNCADATIIDEIVKEVALQNNDMVVTELSNDSEKKFDRLYLEIQIALLLGIQGAMHSMKYNSEALSTHLKRLLCLSAKQNTDGDIEQGSNELIDDVRLLLNSEIIEETAKLDLPFFISI